MKAIKVVGVLLGLLLVSLLAVVVYISTLDPNNYKGLIADKFSEQTGRTLVMDGDIRLTIYPWLGIEVNGVTIGNASGFGDQPFFHADQAMVRIKLMPLLQEQYEIDTIRLHGATINLAKNEAGQTNWADLVSGGETQDTGGLPLAAVILGGVDIQNANLIWDDRGTATHYTISNMMMSTGELVYGAPIQFNLSLNAAANKPELAADVKLSGTIIYDLDNETFDITPFELTTTLTGPNVPNKSAAISLKTAINANLADETLAINNLQFDALDTSLAGNIQISNIESTTPTIQTTIKLAGKDLSMLFKVAEIEPLASQIAKLGNRSFDFAATINADMQRGDVDLSGLQANLLGANVKGDIKATNIESASPAFRGTLNASGPDLPTLMQVLGQLQGGAESALTQYGSKLSHVANKSFVMNTNFDADMGTGNIKMPVLTLKALGTNLSGTLTASNMNQTSGSMTGQFKLTADNPKDLLAALDQSELGEVMQSVNLDVNISGNRANLNIKPFALTMVLAGAKILNSPVTLGLNAVTQMNLEKETLNLDNFSLTGLGLNATGTLKATNILNSPAFNGEVNVAEFNLRTLLQQLNQELPITADTKAYSRVSLATAFDGSSNAMNISKLSMAFDDTKLDGKLSVTDFAKPAIQFGITIDQLNADRYLPPPPKDGNNRTLTPEVAVGAAMQLPVELLRSLNASGDMKVGQLVISKAKLADIVLSLNAKDGLIKLAPVSANLYQGSYAGDINLDATSAEPVLSFKSSLQGVQMDPLMTDFTGSSNISGTGNIELGVSAKGDNTDSLKKSLSGNGKVALEKGILRGVDVAKVLEQVEIMIESKRPMAIDKGVETPFDTFTSTLAINNGVVNSDDLLITAPGIKITGKGTVINLVNDTLDYNLVASADASSVTQGTERYNIGGYSVPIRCRGQVNGPSCVPDVGEILKVAVQKAVQEKVQEKLGDVLQRALGVPAQSQPEQAQPEQAQPATDPAQTQPTEPQPAQQPIDPKQELINRALKSIFK